MEIGIRLNFVKTSEFWCGVFEIHLRHVTVKVYTFPNIAHNKVYIVNIYNY
jgi:hypothetical protein